MVVCCVVSRSTIEHARRHMNIESNPASRLHSLLTALQEGPRDERVLDAWARILEITDRIEVEVPRRLVLLNDLLDEAEEYIKLIPSLNHKIYVSCFPQIRTLFSPLHVHTDRAGFILPHLNPEVMARLEFCAEALQQTWSERSIPQEDLQAISNELNALVESVAASSIDARLRAALLEALEVVRLSISQYRIHGAKALKKSLQGLFGLVFTERAELKKQSEKNADVIDRLGRLIDKIDSTVATAIKIKKALTKPVSYLIGLVADTDQSHADEAPTYSATTSIEA